MLGRGLIFLLSFAALHLCWESVRGTILESWVVHNGTVVPATELIQLLTPDVQAHAAAFSIRAAGGGINLLNGCEGVDALFMLLAALIAAPVSWAARWRGALWGTLMIFGLNELRVLVLFYAYRSDPGLFYSLHANVMPIILVLLICAYYYFWLEHERHSTAPA
jgi:exosortase/archaeosortase family protein